MKKQEMTFEIFKYNVTQWAIERELYTEGTINGQIEKLKEEAKEVEAAYLMVDSQELMREIGDCYAVLHNLCNAIGTTPEECMHKTWLKIKDRKGKMKNGTFVKAEDL